MQAFDDLLDSMIVQKQANPNEVQEIIDDEIFFRYNSVNLVIGKRGSGKTYTTLREILKLPLTGGLLFILTISQTSGDQRGRYPLNLPSQQQYKRKINYKIFFLVRSYY